jgi:hypothetical protein
VPASVLYMSVSLDGFIAGPHDGPDNPGGDGFARLHEWFVSPEGEFVRPTGAATITAAASRSSCPVTGRPVRPSPATRW